VASRDHGHDARRAMFSSHQRRLFEAPIHPTALRDLAAYCLFGIKDHCQPIFLKASSCPIDDAPFGAASPAA